MLQTFALLSLIISVASLVIAAGVTILVAVRARGRSRSLGVAGFGLLTLNLLVQIVAPGLIGIVSDAAGGGRSSGVPMALLIPQGIGVVVGGVALVLIALAVIGHRTEPTAPAGPTAPTAPPWPPASR